MLRRTFLQGSLLAPLAAWLGRSSAEEQTADVFGKEVEPWDMTPGFEVFIPHQTKATHEELHAIAYCAALEIEAFRSLPFEGIQLAKHGYASFDNVVTNVLPFGKPLLPNKVIPLQKENYAHLPLPRMTSQRALPV